MRRTKKISLPSRATIVQAVALAVRLASWAGWLSAVFKAVADVVTQIPEPPND